MGGNSSGFVPIKATHFGNYAWRYQETAKQRGLSHRLPLSPSAPLSVLFPSGWVNREALSYPSLYPRQETWLISVGVAWSRFTLGTFGKVSLKGWELSLALDSWLRCWIKDKVSQPRNKSTRTKPPWGWHSRNGLGFRATQWTRKCLAPDYPGNNTLVSFFPVYPRKAS